MKKQDVRKSLNAVLETMYNLRHEALTTVINNSGNLILPKNAYEYKTLAVSLDEDGNSILMVEKDNGKRAIVSELALENQFLLFGLIAE